ncbi:MAG: biosynthetic arginine decarboxylase, partial [Planctomycetota bacterium]|nr:biosynthetic arginine decarboxylase [Planctomycetota bacterium]
MPRDPIHEPWSPQDSLDLYNVSLWGAGFFHVNDEGRLVVRPRRSEGPSIDLKELVEDLRRRGHDLPLLVRFSDILRERIQEISGCFRRACNEYEYNGGYRGVYPIKVNQQAQVVADLLACGKEHGLGLEVGSKPEMLAALAIHNEPDALIVCNGYKDAAYVETAILAQKLGRYPVLVIDRFRDLEIILHVARQHGIRPHLGVRAKLQARGAGRWAESGGSKSKFGLSTREIMKAVEMLDHEDMLDCLELLHFHIGSQVPSIRTIKDALQEGARIFAELHALGAAMTFFDVGGGLAVDYDGSNTNFHSSMNYSVKEYANDVVDAIGQECEKHNLPHPLIVSESGRALVAHHAALIFDVLDPGVRHDAQSVPEPVEDDHEVVHDLHETLNSIGIRNLLEPYHDAIQLRDGATQLFKHGYLDLQNRAKVEELFYACCSRINGLLGGLPRVPE